ncbi:MAG: hypothetical protein Q9M91_05120 [Candidatus Dojkabacteria bacterium]|nr:hypothetical protein [Candidatus Dojkabacteria bacterium]
MKKLIEKIKGFNNAIGILVGVIILLILINAILGGSQNKDETVSNINSTEYLSVGESEGREIESGVTANEESFLPIESFSQDEDLLSALPEINGYFDADFLPLEENAEPKIIVRLKNEDSRSEFDKWVSDFFLFKC